VGAYVDAVIATTPRQIAQVFHIFEPTTRELERALDALAAEGRIEPALLPGGKAESLPGWVSTAAIRAG